MDLTDNTNTTDVVLGTVAEGNIISAIALRPNMMDSNFLLVPQINERLRDLQTIFSTSSEIEAVRLLTHYRIDYLFFSKNAKLQYKRTALPYTEDTNCFQLVYDNEVQIFRTRCSIKNVT